MLSLLLLRRAFVPILVAVALALVHARPDQEPLHQRSSSAGTTTYCYRRVRTHDHLQPEAQCFSVENGSFARIWRHAHHEHGRGRGHGHGHAHGRDQHEELLDGYVIPGLWDGHGHLMAWGEFLHSVNLFEAPTLDQVRARIKTYLSANPDAGKHDFWLRGTGWDQDLYGQMPTAKDLEQDDALKGKFIMLDRIDGHCIWVSQAILDLLPPNMTDPPGGQIIRDPGPGVFCDTAMDPIYDHWPSTTDDVRARFVKDAMKDLNRVGIVGVHDASTPPDEVKLYSKLADGPDWTVRVYSMMECLESNSFCADDAVKVAREDSRFWVKSVKLFADGALGSWGSAMLSPYSDHTNKTGSSLVNATTMANLATQWAQAGFQVNVHAIGDKANRETIDAFIAALQAVCPGGGEPDSTGDAPSLAREEDVERLRLCQAKHRFRLEHAQIVHPDDQLRMHKIGIIPSVQPTHPTDDMRFALQRLGPQRTDTEAYRMRSFLDLGPLLGSDFPVEPPNPFHGIYAAVTRKNPGTGLGLNGSVDGWHKDEALTFDQAMWGFTGATAYGAFLEGRAGVIKPGAFADWLVLDKPIEDMSVEDLRNLTVKETWIAGMRVYRRGS